MILASLGIALGLVASACLIVALIGFWRQGRRGLSLLSVTGLTAITIGMSASSAVRLYGLARDTDTFDLELGMQLGATAVALALVLIGLVRQRRRASVR